MGTMIQRYMSIIDESELAYRVSNGKIAPWLSKSEIRVDRFRGPDHPHAVVSIPLWLAKKTGLLKTR